jgi:hypothetical protein
MKKILFLETTSEKVFQQIYFELVLAFAFAKSDL